MVKKKTPVALGKYLIVQLIEDESSKIVIPQTVNQATAGACFIVRSVGPKCECGAKIGDQAVAQSQSSSLRLEKDEGPKPSRPKNMKIKIDGHEVRVDTELLAKAIANASQGFADWKAYTGKAETVARELPKIIKIEKTLF